LWFYVPLALVVFIVSHTRALDIFFDPFESDSLMNSQTSLVHWDVTQGNVDVSGPGNTASVDSFGNPASSQFVDLDGSGTGGVAFDIETKDTSTLAPGDYILSFELARDNFVGGGGTATDLP
jgi:hypothetical protein